MRATRRYWAIAGMGLFLAGFAVLLQSLPVLVGAAGVGAWLFVKQYAFVRALDRTIDGLTIEQTVPRERVVAETETEGRMHASLPFASPLAVRIEAQPPIAATNSSRAARTIGIERGEREAMGTFSLRWPVAGTFAFDRPSIEVTDTDGLFGERLSRGPEPTVVVEPRSPRDVHVGMAGERSLRAYGRRDSAQRAAGLDPGELREYHPGDTTRQIDWKTTARLNSLHVREYEIESDRVTALFFDHRGAMATGRPGERKFDYARQVALALIDDVHNASDPLGYYTVGNDGCTGRRKPIAGQYESVRRRLRDLQPMETGDSTAPTTERNVETIRRFGAALDGESRFETTLAPYYRSSFDAAEPLTADPLLETVRTQLAQLTGPVLTAIFTDDTDGRAVQETVEVARRQQGRVLVFLTPSALFESAGLSDLEVAYDRYREFESFRRRLAGLDDVTAFEVGPGDRLDAVLATGRRRRARTP